MKLITPGVSDLLRVTKDAQARLSAFPAGDYLGQVGLAQYHELGTSIPDEIKTRLTELNQALLAGDVQTGVSPVSP